MPDERDVPRLTLVIERDNQGLKWVARVYSPSNRLLWEGLGEDPNEAAATGVDAMELLEKGFMP